MMHPGLTHISMLQLGSSLKRYSAGARARDLFGEARCEITSQSIYIKCLPLLIKSNAQVFEITEQSLELKLELDVDVEVAT